MSITEDERDDLPEIEIDLEEPEIEVVCRLPLLERCRNFYKSFWFTVKVLEGIDSRTCGNQIIGNGWRRSNACI